MTDQRPDPDALLRELKLKEETRTGKLKIFFGYAAGVGKTYAMLEAAHHAKEMGVDVVAGYIEPHVRPETLALLDGLEQLPNKEIPYKNITLREFDLDGALARKPQLILVDELAHTNAAGSRHRKRYQDIEELLRAGISVYTTVNVQHLESLNDVVASITGIAVAERLPDRIFDRADQVEVVDIEPADLLERLKEGKIYRPNQAARAMDHFFTLKNLAALREIALRRTADRLNRAADTGVGTKAKSSEHILVCLSGAPSNANVIRTAARMAEAFRSSFTALFVETSDFKDMSDDNRSRLRANLRLAEELGARIATVYGDDTPLQIAEYARASGVTKIVLGRSNNKRFFWERSKNLVDRLNALAPDLDIHIIPDTYPAYRAPRKSWNLSERFTVKDALRTLVILAVSICVKLYMCLYNRRIGKKIRSAAMEATAADSLSDTAATAAVLLAMLIAKWTGLDIDGWVGLVVAGFILFSGVKSARETISPLLGQPPEKEFVDRIQAIVLSHPEILGLHDLVVHDYGPGRVMVSLHAEVPAHGDLLELHDVVDNIEMDLSRQLNCQAVIHMDPVVTDDGLTGPLRSRVAELVKQVDPAITIHDFRVVAGPTHTNLVFDAVVPFDEKLTAAQAAEKIRALVRTMDDGRYFAVVTVENSYI